MPIRTSICTRSITIANTYDELLRIAVHNFAISAPIWKIYVHSPATHLKVKKIRYLLYYYIKFKMNVHQLSTASCLYFHLATAGRERNIGFHFDIIWNRNFTNIRQLTERAEWWIPNEKSDASASAKRGQKQQDSTLLLISTPFDIFDENVLQPSCKKRTAFSDKVAFTALPLILIYCVRFAIVQLKKKQMR